MRYLKVSNDMIESKLIAKNCNKNYPRENTWPNHVKMSSISDPKRPTDPKNTLNTMIQQTANENAVPQF